MKLQKRLLLYVGGFCLLFFFFILALFILLVVQGVQDEENEFIVQTVNRFDSVINERQYFLSKMVVDWARRDDSYAFVRGESSDYVSRNINSETFKNLGLNIIIIVNDSGDVVYEGYYNLSGHRELNLTSEQRSELFSKLNIGGYPHGGGLTSFQGLPVFFAAEKVTSSDGMNETDGYIIFAKYFDSEDLESIGDYVGANVNVSVISIKNDSSGYGEGVVDMGGGVYRRYVEGDRIECLREIYDFSGEKVGVAHIVFYRGSFVRIMNALNYFIVMLAVCLIISGVIIFFVVEKSIVERLLKLESLISHMISTGDLSKKIDEGGDDELSSLSKSFNTLTSLVCEERRQLTEKNRELEEKNRELRRLDELKSRFLANVSHETRTPLTVIESYTQMLADGLLGPVNDKQREALSVILSSSKSLNELLSEILDASKYETGNVVLSKSEVNLFDLLNLVRKEFEPVFSKINAEMKLDVRETLTLSVDREKMVQVFRNLISNSVKYRGDRKLVVNVSAEDMGDKVAIVFRDNGVGMSEEALKNVFSRFYRAPEVSGKAEGAGLGLSIAKSIIDLHGGRIEVESRCGEYTLFRIILPKK